MMLDWLDILTTILGLIYIWLEYRAHIALWVIGIVMPALDIILYWQHGLYGDAGMACYYTLAACYGLFVWKFVKTAHHVDQLYRSPTRLVHQCPVVCRHVGVGPQIYRAVVLLDCRRCRLLRALRTERYSLQGWSLRTLCHHRYSRIFQMEKNFDAVIIANGVFPTHSIPLNILHHTAHLIACDGARWRQRAC